MKYSFYGGVTAGLKFDGARVEKSCRIRLVAPAVAFGDTWRICSQACNAAAMGFEVKINPVAVRGAGWNETWQGNRVPGYDHSKFVRSVLDELSYGDRVQLDPTCDTNAHIDHEVFFSGWPCNLRWRGGSRVLAFQFDGYAKDHPKNPEPGDALAFVSCGRALGFEPVDVGGFRPIAESCDIVRHAAYYVGIDSGLAQLAYSLGAPSILVQYGTQSETLKRWHGHCPKWRFRNLRGVACFLARNRGYCGKSS